MNLCTVCGVVTSRAGSRCTEHARRSNRSRHNVLYSTRAWQRLSARVLRAWRGEETGLAATRIRMILMNPLYNGWIRRHRGPSETRRPAPWRFDPPVSDDLWARVEDV